MIISNRHGFIFIHTPKCAGTSFRQALEPYNDHEENFWGPEFDPYFQRDVDKAHLRLWELAAIRPQIFTRLESMNSLTFVRDPFARLVSAITEHFFRFRHHELLFEQSPGARQFMIERFVREELTLERVMGDCRFVHFSPQSWFINLGAARKVRHLVPLTEEGDPMAEAMRRLGLEGEVPPKQNVRLGEQGALHFSDFLRDFAAAFYREDYALLGAEPALAQALRLQERAAMQLRPPAPRRPAHLAPFLRHQVRRVGRRLRRGYVSAP